MSPRERISAAVRRLRDDPKASPTVRVFAWAWPLAKAAWKGLWVVVKSWTIRTAALAALAAVWKDVETVHELNKLVIEAAKTLNQLPPLPVSAFTGIHLALVIACFAALFGEEEFRDLLKRITFAVGAKVGYERVDQHVSVSGTLPSKKDDESFDG